MANEGAGLVEGTRLGPYEVLSPVGSGGMGDVYRAKDTRLGRLVAVKVLPREVASDPERRKRFEREARAVAALSHPNICTVFDVGREETPSGPVDYLVMELLEGESLAQRLRKGSLPTEQVLKVGMEIASALDKAHRAGVVHRDVKPGNIVLTKAGAKLLDFGLARLRPTAASLDAESAAVTEQETRDDSLTEDGRAVGTYPYMAPEQLEGKAADARADLFALGAVLYEMATGRRAFEGTSQASVAAAILTSEPPPLTALRPVTPIALERLVKLLLTKDPDERIQSAHDVALRLREIADGEPGEGMRPISKRPKPSWTWVVAAAGLAAALAFFLPRIWPWRSDASRETTPPLLLTRLTSEPGVQMDPALSPDGKMLVYAADRDGNVDLWVRPVSGGSPVRITSDPLPDWQPDWSPDGSRIVFRSERDGGGIYVMSALGGSAQRIAAFGYGPTWSTDSLHILLQNQLSFIGRGYLLDLGAGEPRPIAAAAKSGEVLDPPIWHPDGKHLSFFGWHGPRGRPFVRMVSIANGRHRDGEYRPSAWQQHHDAGITWYRAVRWAPSGSAIFFEARARDTASLWRCHIDPATLEVTDLQRVTAGASRESGFHLSADGRRAVFVVSEERHPIWSLPIDAVTRRTRGEGEALFPGLGHSACDVSRDGARVVCSRTEQDRAYLWVGDIRERKQSDISGDQIPRSGTRSVVALSPDGRHVAYTREDGVFVLGLHEGEERLLRRHAPRLSVPYSWSPDGRFVVGTSPRDASHADSTVWMAPATSDAGREQLIASSTSRDLWQARLSPDGRWLAFIASDFDSPNGSVIWVAPRSGGNWTQLTEGPWDDRPAWAADGRILYFLAKRSGFFNVWGIPFDLESGKARGAAFPVTTFDRPSRMIPDPVEYEAFYGFSKDRLLVSLVERSSNIWMVENIDR